MNVYTVRHSQQSDQGLYYLSFSAIWSRSTLSFWAVWSGSILFAIRSSLIKVKVNSHPQEQSSLIKVYTICHSQPTDHVLHYFPFFLSSIIKVYTVCHFQLSDQGLHYLSVSAVWSGSSLFAILSRLVTVYTICHSQLSDQGQFLHCHSQEQSDQDLHYLQF